jgi:mRNA-degrading endonuclease YafQ of YafQ-DinJ toxin-antitoxin module
MCIEYSKKFIKEFKKCPDNVKTNFKTRLKIFIDNQYYPLLNNHSLFGEFDNCRSINITGGLASDF